MIGIKSRIRLNAICPYFTMFPYEFPAGYLSRRRSSDHWVLDPFCGRGTTNLAARVLGLPSIGIDSNPVAAAVTEAKMADVSPEAVVECAGKLLESTRRTDVPEGAFWRLAFEPSVLQILCRLRDSLIHNCESAERRALRGIILGALHGPVRKTPSHFSNQAPRTYAPKPDYSVRYWRRHGHTPPRVDAMDIISTRAHRYYAHSIPDTVSVVHCGDSRDPDLFRETRLIMREHGGLVKRVVTSPPYYGMRTYRQDQWLRNWFLGGPAEVDYDTGGQIQHTGQAHFVSELRTVWLNVGTMCEPGATMAVRFGSISHRRVDHKEMIQQSFAGTGWRVTTIRSAGTASHGNRQARSFAKSPAPPAAEMDAYLVWTGDPGPS